MVFEDVLVAFAGRAEFDPSNPQFIRQEIVGVSQSFTAIWAPTTQIAPETLYQRNSNICVMMLLKFICTVDNRNIESYIVKSW